MHYLLERTHKITVIMVAYRLGNVLDGLMCGAKQHTGPLDSEIGQITREGFSGGLLKQITDICGV